MNEKKDNPLTSVVKEGGQTANATVDTAGKLASHTITDAGKVGQSAEHAVTGVGSGAIQGVGKMGGEVGGLAKDAVMNTAAVPKEIIKSAETGKPSK